MKPFAMLTAFVISSSVVLAAPAESVKGLLSEIRLSESNEELNQAKAFNSEVLITRTENKAIDSLKTIIKKKAGTREEADLLYRLAELYMRRAKSGRYFDLDKSSDGKLKNLGLGNQRANDALKQAVQIYKQILARFPSYHDLDYVYFNSALAHAQLKDNDTSKKHYLQLIAQFPKSELVADALLEVGEIYYLQQNFTTALEKFKEIEKFPESKAYPYGLYKSAWCYYNLKNTDEGIKQLLTVVKQNPADIGDKKKYNLRKEALRDLTLFTGETLAAKELLPFFKKICTEDELGEVMANMTNLYESHSRFKEISVFVDEFIDDYPNHKQSPKLYTKLIETLETLKLRDKVISKLSDMASFCKNEKRDESCKKEFKHISIEISKKWWEIWLKNKSNTEFSNLTEQAFENLLSTDEEKAPDSSSRYAFAELLFQQNKFERAAEQYEIVSKHLQITSVMKHDSLYGALFSVEKQIEKKENSKLTEKQKELGLRYITEFKTGEHFETVSFKLGFIAYSQQQLDLALNYFEPLSKSKTQTLREKTEDLLLDIYNIKKDYSKIRNMADSFNVKTITSERKDSLTKIAEQAHYAEVQANAKNLAAAKQIDLLLSFSKEHQKTQLGQDSYWQSISVAYANSLDVRGAELSLDYVRLYPTDKRNTDALKEAAKSFLDAGHLTAAINTLKMLSEKDSISAYKNTNLICDLWQIQNEKNEARKCLQSLLKLAPSENRSEITGKLLKTFIDTNSPEYIMLQNNILSTGIEPYATKVLIEKARALLNKNDFKAAFDLSLKINARPVGEDQRAEARLIQAKILEGEFVSQSIKAREDRLAMVIAMKTEKLDKSFTAYSSAIKMAKDTKLQEEGLKGIVRLYTNFIDSISNISLPSTLPEADKQALKSELAKIVTPFADKRKNTLDQLQAIAGPTTESVAAKNWTSISIESSYEPAVVFPSPEKLTSILGSENDLNKLVREKKYDQATERALQLTSTKEKRAVGLHYLSVISESESNKEKSLWFINKALEIQPDLAMANFQKAKVLYSVEGFNTSFKYFEKAFNTLENHTESRLIVALKAFSDRDFKRANKEFSRFSFEEIYTYEVDLIFVEAKLQAGETEEALKLAETSFRKNPDRVELDLVFAKIYEGYLFNKEKTNMYYNRALGKAKSQEQQNWLNKKLEFLKTNKSNQISSYVGG